MINNIRHIIFYFFLIYILLIPNYSYSKEIINILIKDKSYSVEIARLPLERRIGLMNRDSLPVNHGMLFVFEYERHLSFWMKNTKIPLDIAFIERDGTITEIQNMLPYSLKSIKSKFPVLYALELSKGSFHKIGALQGDKIIFPKGFK